MKYKIVPATATAAMCAAFNDAEDGGWAAAHSAMLAAAPEPDWEARGHRVYVAFVLAQDKGGQPIDWMAAALREEFGG